MTIFVFDEVFTFHYVSIKSPYQNKVVDVSLLFTFHYVSIKSSGCGVTCTIAKKFTFHYVSIKSTDVEDNHIHGNIFTFHYVSIKSVFAKCRASFDIDLHSTMYLLNHIARRLNLKRIPIYIPLCIY